MSSCLPRRLQRESRVKYALGRKSYNGIRCNACRMICTAKVAVRQRDRIENRLLRLINAHANEVILGWIRQPQFPKNFRSAKSSQICTLFEAVFLQRLGQTWLQNLIWTYLKRREAPRSHITLDVAKWS